MAATVYKHSYIIANETTLCSAAQSEDVYADGTSPTGSKRLRKCMIGDIAEMINGNYLIKRTGPISHFAIPITTSIVGSPPLFF